MIKKFLLGLCILVFVFAVFASTNARMFDLRTNKAPKKSSKVSFDNLHNLMEGGYSGIYVGDTVKISGETNGYREVKIVFPSGKSVTLQVKGKAKNYFEKTITFDEEGTYKVMPLNKTFEVCYRVKALPPVTFLRDIVGERIANDDYDKTFINWNNAIALETGDSLRRPLPVFSIIVFDKNGNPIPDLTAKKFKTNKLGIAEITGGLNSSTIYGDLRSVRYKKFVYDSTGKFVYGSTSKKLKDGFMEKDTGRLLIDAKDFLDALSLPSVNSNDLTIGDTYVKFGNGTAYPAIVKGKNNVKYVNAESVLASIDTRSSGILGTAIEYHSNKTIVYVAFSNGGKE